MNELLTVILWLQKLNRLFANTPWKTAITIKQAEKQLKNTPL